ncbi:hypothetical protein R1sor_003976 [Riccia sorocarpa]|uniref:Uncharacterized protein n=1 Tax=Riccia sorocarpa TaxID=122646 RepID=A0ABD3H9A5_9MARC
MRDQFVGKRLPSIRLMEAELFTQFASAGHSFLKKIAEFVPYSFKDLANVDEVEFAAMNSFKILKYVTGLQRLCIPEDVFWYAFWNTDADGDRLLIKGMDGATCVVGWHEVSVAFGASHSETEDFRAIKINNKAFSQYRPGEFLPETVETNAQRKLVNGQPYEEISYYKEAAPYGPTYFLMSVIAELFLCNGRSTRFTTPMVYAYMRSIHGFQTNWSKVILHCLKTKICFLQNPEAWVPWVHMSKEGDLDLRGLHAKFPTPLTDMRVIRDRCRLTDQIPLAEPVTADPEEDGGTPAKLPARKRKAQVNSVEHVRTVHTRLAANPHYSVPKPIDPGTSSPPSTSTDEDSNEDARVNDSIFRDFGVKISSALGDLVSHRLEKSFRPLLADANASEALKTEVTELKGKLEVAEKSRLDLNGQVAALKAEILQLNAKVADEATRSIRLQLQKELNKVKQDSVAANSTIGRLQADLKVARQDVSTRAKQEEELKARMKSLSGQMDALKVDSDATIAKLREELSVSQQQLQTHKVSVDRYKTAFQKEMQKTGGLDEQIVLLKGQFESQKFAAERAEKAEATLRSELSKVKTELRMLQIDGN